MTHALSFPERVINLACEIQSIPAPTFQEKRRANYFFQKFRSIGLVDVQMDSTGNVLGLLPGMGKGRPLVISAHMDTVHPLDTPLDVRHLNDRVIGPGIGDNALGLAAMLGMVDMLHERQAQLPGDVWLAANVCEEGLGDLRGIQAIVDRFGTYPVAYLVIEGIGLGTILHRGLGVERYKITINTPGGHSWVDYGQPSAIHELSKLVALLADYPLSKNPCTTLNVGIIHGGTSVNTIAAHAWIELDLRSEDSKTLTALVRAVHRLAEGFNKPPRVQVSIDRIGMRQAGFIPAGHPLVRLASSVLLNLGIDPRLDIASTDANLPLSRGCPSICIGITHGNNAHTREEFIVRDPVAKGMEQLYQLVTKMWSWNNESQLK